MWAYPGEANIWELEHLQRSTIETAASFGDDAIAEPRRNRQS
jgi:hypothetical protein